VTVVKTNAGLMIRSLSFGAGCPLRLVRPHLLSLIMAYCYGIGHNGANS
jgi:hypothetical protein